MNGLGTCKHIEAALIKLRKGRIRKFKQAAKTGSPRVEIHLDPQREQVRISWPQDPPPAVRKLLEPFFSADGSLLDYEAATSHNVTVRVPTAGA